ncbi:MAG: type VI secretion system baseplate subunit TssG [Acidobacteriia bacterium]|nr:type VI secretion system baseplate subunit TssG [Terriglobia bacterium]
MTSFGWQGEGSVAKWLFTEPYRFDFFQAVRLLEISQSDAVCVGRNPDTGCGPVRFLSRVGLDFPASEIHQITKSKDSDSSIEMTVNFLSLAGAFGPLPMPDTELVLNRIRSRDWASKDFLDIFNHRLVELMYRIRKLHRVSLSTVSPERTPIAQYLYSFFGLGIPAVRNRMGVPDRALLHTAGILSQQPRSAAGLERLLACHFQVRVSVRQLVGKWRPLEFTEWTRIGNARGQNHKLGGGAALGTRFWDQQGAFLVQLGPLGQTEFLDFLPAGSAYRASRELARLYAGPEFDFFFRLTMEAAAVPESRLGRSRLGWTSWLKTRPFPADDSQVLLRN